MDVQIKVMTLMGSLLLILIGQEALGQSCTNEVSYRGAIGAGDLTQNGRLQRDGDPSTCQIPKSCPGEFDLDPRRYDVYRFTNRSGGPICAEVVITTSCGDDRLFSVAYANEFVSTDLCANYIGDSGYSGFTNRYSLEVPCDGVFTVVVHEVNPGIGCDNYSLKVSGFCDANGRRPRLTLTPDTTGLRLTWSSCGNFQLQSTSSLAPLKWTTVTNTPTESEKGRFVTLERTSTSRFFRLVEK